MKKIKVIVKDKTTLELLEAASAGDIIDLEELVQVDTSYIDKIIESNKDSIYNTKLAKEKEILAAQHKLEILELNNKIELLKQEFQKEKNDAIYEKEVALKNKYYSLEQEYNILRNKYSLDIENTKLGVEKSYIDEINNLKNQIKLSESDFEIKKRDELDALRQKYDAIINEKEDTINKLQRSKAAMNVKQTGEDLESWCDNEVLSYMQNGLFNCTWEKDNLVVRESNEQKGSKADYIFKVYADEKHNEQDLLASICLDMKDENPDSVNKKKNADYYKQLEQNRIKKNCKYSVLVSNLEIDRPNDVPIFKVREYENMYVVRPAYLMVFLNMITSLTTRFSDIIQNDEKESLALKGKHQLIEDFNKIKNTYLDKPLASLETTIETIIKNSTAVKDAAKKIDDCCEKIKSDYILEIEQKITRFELKLNSGIIKKLDE